MKSLLKNIITGGLGGEYDSPQVRKAILYNLFCFIGLFFFITYSIQYFIRFMPKHASVLLLLMVLMVGSNLFFRKTKNYNLASNILIAIMLCLNVFLLVSGGVKGSGALWVFVLPILAYYASGKLYGSIFSGFLFVFSIFCFFSKLNWIAKYDVDYSARIVSIYFAVAVMSYIYEFVRERTYNSLIELNKKKTEYLDQISDSIKYAKRIQQALLPSNLSFENYFPNSFVYFKPKEVVSGDFSYITKHNDLIYVAVADCTGHGVPGAFMSMLGFSMLNEIIVSKNISEPKDILQALHQGIFQSLHQDNIDQKTQDDGMDISLICFDLINLKATISSANQTPLMIYNGEMTQFDTSCFSIGEPRAIKKGLEFKQKTIDICKGQRFFMFSDGFQDQFGGEMGKKYQKSKLITLLNSESKLSEYSALLEKEYFSWTQFENSKYSQMDDIIIFGIEI